MAKPKHTRAEIREHMKYSANRSRDLADEMALMWDGCDDPMHPFGPQVFRDWIDFTERVCRPLVEADGQDEPAIQAAMALYRKQCPYAICVSLVMALNKINDLTSERDRQADVLSELIAQDDADRGR